MQEQTVEQTQALNAVARTRVLGMHFFGHFLGIGTASRVDGATRIRLDPPPLTAPECSGSPTALATLADLALSAAVRHEVGPHHRLGTVTLGMHLMAPCPVGTVTALAHPVWVDTTDGHGHARCELRDDDGGLVGTAQGWFAVLPVPDGTRMPPALWEGEQAPPVPELSPAELSAVEQTVVRAGEAALERARERGTLPGEELLALGWSDPAGADRVRGSASVGPELANRVRHVQGGATYGAAVAAAARAAGPGMRLADGHLQYLKPADGAALSVEARVLRRGRRAVFTEVELSVDGRQVASGQFAFRPAR